MAEPVTTFVGFDSAWTDNAKTPGAICAVQLRGSEVLDFHEPCLVGFGAALEFIQRLHDPEGVSIVALDQPTIVRNPTSMRPVERVAASFVGWLGGGVQPSNTDRIGMFCPAAPVWAFLKALGAAEDPVAARDATRGIHLVEVFPAIALPSLDSRFFGRKRAPRYNPARKGTFRVADWHAVAEVAAAQFESFGMGHAATTCRRAREVDHPRKSDQDKLDALLCLIVALHWRLRPASGTLMLGSLETGYMVMPASEAVRRRLAERADLVGVPCA